jgi:hypothetical protein
MSAVLFWILFALVLLAICPDPWQARREIAKRQAEARRETHPHARYRRVSRSRSRARWLRRW